jgi:hypothetical protein
MRPNGGAKNAHALASGLAVFRCLAPVYLCDCSSAW